MDTPAHQCRSDTHAREFVEQGPAAFACQSMKSGGMGGGSYSMRAELVSVRCLVGRQFVSHNPAACL
jgi:hypothetical protein